jgi:hypothetical protein
VSGNFSRHHKLERLLARVLDQGTWLASGIIGVGWLLSVAGWQSVALINGGIALFLLLPVLRVAIMLVVFVRERDYRFGLIAGVVLAIIVLGALLGIGIRSDSRTGCVTAPGCFRDSPACFFRPEVLLTVTCYRMSHHEKGTPAAGRPGARASDNPLEARRNDCHGHPRAARSQAQGSDCANGATAPRR